jgi:hypothetical protein
MSYNIDSCEIISSKGFRVHKDKADAATNKVGSDGPEAWPFEDLDFDEDGYAEIDSWNFYGEGSGWAFRDGSFAEFAQATEGEADIILTWEGGDSHSGARIKDGKVTFHKVVMALGEAVK